MAPSVGPTHGVQAIANAAPATTGPPRPAFSMSVSGCHSRLIRATKTEAMKKTPITMIATPRDLVERLLVVAQQRPGGGRAQPEQDEDGRERGDEDQAPGDQPRVDAPVADRGARPAHRGQVARHERQHARRDERDEAGREGQR